MLRGYQQRLNRRFSAAPRRRLFVVLSVALCAAWFSGCEEGQPPYEVIPGSTSPDFLPPDGITPGVTSEFDSLYFFDGTIFQETDPQPATPFEFIKRGKILALLGASIEDKIRPDQSDPTLARVYQSSHLLGFERAVDPGDIDTFHAGPIIGEASVFYPLSNSAGVSVWFYNHNGNEWARRDTLLGPDFAPDSQAAPPGQVWRLSAQNVVRADRRLTFIPNVFDFDYLVSSVPNEGIFLHSYTIVSERVEVLGEDGVPQPQRNPRTLWLSRDALGISDPNSPIPSAIDQCLDNMWGTLELFPIHLAGQLPGSPAGTAQGEMRVGDRIVTWTYLAVDEDELAPRLGDPTAVPPIDPIPRCAGAGVELAPQFPTGTFSILARYEAVVEDAYDVWEERGGQAGVSALVGSYGTAGDGVIDVVKVVVTMWLGAPFPQLTERIEIFLQRDIGPVVINTGVRNATVLRTRLRNCTVNGQLFDEAFFDYAD